MSLAQFSELSQPKREIFLRQPNVFILVECDKRTMQCLRRMKLCGVNPVDYPEHAVNLNRMTGFMPTQWLVSGKQYRVINVGRGNKTIQSKKVRLRLRDR